MKNRILSMLLAVMLAVSVFCGAALAEETASAIDLTDLTLTIGENSYAFPMSIDACKEAGLNVPEFAALTEGQYYPYVGVNNGSDKFDLRVELCAGDHWATGFTARNDEIPGAKVGDIVLGETTRREITDALGEPRYSYDDNVSYYTFGSMLIWNIYFDGASDQAKVSKIIAHSKIPGEFGAEFVVICGTEAADAAELTFTEFILNGKKYAPGTTVQNLLDDGWVLANSIVDTVEPSAGFLVYGDSGYLYNGVGLVYIKAYNYSTDKEIPFAECMVNSVETWDSYKTSLVFAGGITVDSTLAEAEAVLGAHVSETVTDDGLNEYSFEVEEGADYTIRTNDAGEIIFMAISDMN